MDRTSDLKSTLPGIEPVPAKSGGMKRKAPSSDKAPASAGGFGALKVGQKLSLIVLAFAIPIAVLLYLLISEQNKAIAFAAKERQGVEYLTPLMQVLKTLPEHRGMSNSLLSGDQGFADRRAKKAAEVDAAIAAVAGVDAKYGSAFGSTQAFDKLRKEWQALRGRVLSLSASESFALHTKLMSEQVIPLVTQVGNQSNLILDPDLDSYYVMDLVVSRLPELTETLGQMRGSGSGILARQTMSTTERGNQLFLQARSRVGLEGTNNSVNYAVTANSELSSLSTTSRTASSQLEAALKLQQAEILDAKALRFSSGAYFDQLSSAIGTYFKLYQDALPLLDGLLAKRIGKLEGNRLVSLGVVALGLVIAAGFLFWITQLITRPLGQLTTAANRLAAGDFEINVPITSNDEVGVLTQTLNATAKELKAKAQADREQLEASKELQQNIGDFLNVTMDIAQGDLTKKGKVTEDVLGNVVDAINLMTEEIGYVLKDVQGVTQSVSGNANLMSATTDAVLQGAQTQASEAAQAQADTQAMTNAIRKMAQRAVDSSSAAQQTLQSAQSGQEAVNNTLSGMQSIRREVSSISKGIKGLSDRSLEISEIVETLGSIASQTNLLALNAAIEASGAGEAGSRFAIVADEVRKLADDSAKAAGRVGGLIKNVQTEIQELVASVEGGTKEVEQGYRIAQQAGERLREIADLANQSSALAQAISSAAQQQVQGVERVANAVQSIASTAQRTQDESAKGRQSAEQLRSLASQLSGTLERFRLPA